MLMVIMILMLMMIMLMILMMVIMISQPMVGDLLVVVQEHRETTVPIISYHISIFKVGIYNSDLILI